MMTKDAILNKMFFFMMRSNLLILIRSSGIVNNQAVDRKIQAG